MSGNLCFTSAADLAERIRAGAVSPVEVLEATFDRIDDRNDRITAYVTLRREDARREAEAAERAVEAGESLGPLHGVPVAIKDLGGFKRGVRHSFGLAPCTDYVPDFDAPIVERLEDAGAIVVGKTNTPPLGAKDVTKNIPFGSTGTPFDPTKNAGGSSGGSAAAVADGLAALGQGSDIGGSVRTPASMCGVVGLKPSFGRIPLVDPGDVFAHHAPFYHLGPIARTVEDAALMLDVTAGPHPGDPFSLPDPTGSYVDSVARSVDGVRVGYSPDLGLYSVDERVRSVVDEAVGAFESAGASLERVDPEFDHALAELAETYTTEFNLWLGGATTWFEDELGIDLLGLDADELEPEVAQLIAAGREVAGMEYKRGETVQTGLYRTLQDFFGAYDLLVTPTLAVPPVDRESEGPTVQAGAGSEMESLAWNMNWPFNLTGHPVASVPAGWTDDGLPVGMQVVGRRHRDDDVLAAAAAYERENPWHDRYPP